MSNVATFVGFVVIAVVLALGAFTALAYIIDRVSRGWYLTKLLLAAASLVVKDRRRVEVQLEIMWPLCQTCGERNRTVKYRGWTDEGSPIKTCAKCGAPEVRSPASQEGDQ